jgi:hypothetical protein
MAVATSVVVKPAEVGEVAQRLVVGDEGAIGVGRAVHEGRDAAADQGYETGDGERQRAWNSNPRITSWSLHLQTENSSQRERRHKRRPGPDVLSHRGRAVPVGGDEKSYFFGLGQSACERTPMMSPWARCAGTAFSDTSMKTHGLRLEPVRWQMPTFWFFGFVVVVAFGGFVVVVAFGGFVVVVALMVVVVFGGFVVVVAFLVVVVSFLTVVVAFLTVVAVVGGGYDPVPLVGPVAYASHALVINAIAMRKLTAPSR